MVLNSLKENIEIRILHAHKGNCTVLNESTCKKISSLLESGVYKILYKDLKSRGR
jgi:hypothetical protein